jgi:hypothetical protein
MRWVHITVVRCPLRSSLVAQQLRLKFNTTKFQVKPEGFGSSGESEYSIYVLCDEKTPPESSEVLKMVWFACGVEETLLAHHVA